VNRSDNDTPLLPGLDPEQATLAQDPSEDQGRIGYGKRGGLWTPLGLALILIAVLVAIGIYNRNESDLPENDIEIGAVAPDITQATFTGETFSLAEHRGKVVIVNFWATWCDPCRNEMPLLQATADSDPNGIALVGINIRNDSAYAAQRFLETNGLTYANVRDDAVGGTDGFGPIELAYGIGTTRPVTIFISPNGEIAAFKLGELTEDDLDHYIEEARGYTGEA
jgi:cytochrome c biogenesis protein CcmG, thiol:disulfide interchange protein DsbE